MRPEKRPERLRMTTRTERSRRPLKLPEFGLVQRHETGKEARETENNRENDKRSRRPLILPEFGLVQRHETEVEPGEETRETEEDTEDDN